MVVGEQNIRKDACGGDSSIYIFVALVRKQKNTTESKRRKMKQRQTRLDEE